MGRGGSSSGKCWACDKAVPGLGGHGKKKGAMQLCLSLVYVFVCVQQTGTFINSTQNNLKQRRALRQSWSQRVLLSRLYEAGTT